VGKKKKDGKSFFFSNRNLSLFAQGGKVLEKKDKN